MRVTVKTVLQGAMVACGLLLATAGEAWSAPVHIQWAGSGWDTHIDNLGDGFPLDITVAQATGSFGASRIEVSAEFNPYDLEDIEGIECAEGYDVLFGILYSANVATFQANDQLYGVSDSGWMCLSRETGHYYGEVYGIYVGGTGRFLGADGWWATTFEGQNLEGPEAITGLAPIGFRSISGKMHGQVNMHGSGAD